MDALSGAAHRPRWFPSVLSLVGTFDEAVDNATDYLAAVEEQRREGFTVLSVGRISGGEEDLATGETIGGVIALVVLIVVFAAVLAPLLPRICSASRRRRRSKRGSRSSSSRFSLG